MTESDLVSRLEDESSRRVKEIGNLMLGVMTQPNAEAVAALSQGCIVLLYAHLDGFVRNASRHYLLFLEGQTPDLQGLSGEWLGERSVVSVARLREIIWCMRMDYHPFRRKESIVKMLKGRRDKIAHGKQSEENARMRKEDIRQMADQVLGIIEDFKRELIKII